MWSDEMRNRNRVPTWEAWFSLLFSLLSLLAWTKSEALIESLLRAKLVDESATYSLPGVIAFFAIVAIIGGLAGAWQFWALAGGLLADACGIIGRRLYRWPPTRAIIDLSGTLLIPIFAAAKIGAGAALSIMVRLKSITLACLKLSLRTFIRAMQGYLGLVMELGGLCASAAKLAQGLASAIARYIMRLGAAVAGFLRPVATAVLGFIGRVVSTVLGYLWRQTRAVFLFLRLVAVLVLGFLGSAVRAISGLLWPIAHAVAHFLRLGIASILRYSWRSVSLVFLSLSRPLSAIAVYVRKLPSAVVGFLSPILYVVASGLWRAGSAVIRVLWLEILKMLRLLGLGISTAASLVWVGVSAVGRSLGLVAFSAFGYVRLATILVFGYFWRALVGALSYVGRSAYAVVSRVWSVVSDISRYVWSKTSLITVLLGSAVYAGLRHLWLTIAGVSSALWGPVTGILGYLWQGVSAVCGRSWSGVHFFLSHIWRAVSSVAGYLWSGIAAILVLMGRGVVALSRILAVIFVYLVGYPIEYIWRGLDALLDALFALLRPGISAILSFLWLGVDTLFRLLAFSIERIPAYFFRAFLIGSLAIPDAFRMAIWMVFNRNTTPRLADFNLSSGRLLSVSGPLSLAGIVFIAFLLWPREQIVVVTHWANGHVMRPMLLPDMANRFNQLAFRTESGKRIEVRPAYYGSAEQADDLVSRATRGTRISPNLADPVIVTPSADHWLAFANNAAGRTLVDLKNTQSIARTWIGIVTYRDMAECLGWPDKEIGYADIIALRSDPKGWASYPCAKAEWGQQPLLSYTDPATSSTGRSALFTLYSIAAGKTPDQLTMADVTDRNVVGYVKQFQGLVDHYLAGTIPQNTKIYLGPRYGQFFLMPEDNLIHLYQGTESAVINGVQVKAPPIAKPMVMIYPKEGSTEHNHSASFVQAPWVSEEQVEAAQKWVSFVREEGQQNAFMTAGFRPAISIPLGDPISSKFGLDPSKPTVVVNADRIDQVAGPAIVKSWDDVKKPGIVTFVVDVSGSMMGAKMEQAKIGLSRALDSMPKNNEVGMVSFADTIVGRVQVAPLAANHAAIARAVESMRAQGNTDLYDAVKAGIEMADAAQGDENAIRGVVVLTDGHANRGSAGLNDLIRLMSRNEVPISGFRGFENDKGAVDAAGRSIGKKDMVGTGLALNTRHEIRVFFIGLGKDADMEVGRMLAEATGATFRGATEKDLAAVIEEFGKYF